ncbi:hypothetical protein JW960_04365 [candidate division KSB1 bacterium]|nr:hypothetical protein [candidate division KSB1 bacterium]
MKKQLVLIIFIIFSFLNCSSNEKQGNDNVSMKDIKNKAQDVVETTGEYTAQQMEQYQQELQAQIDSLSNDIQAMQMKTKYTTEKTKIELNLEIASLDTNLTELKNRANQLQSASGQAWRDLKAGIDESIATLEQAIKTSKHDLKTLPQNSGRGN